MLREGGKVGEGMEGEGRRSLGGVGCGARRPAGARGPRTAKRRA